MENKQLLELLKFINDSEIMTHLTNGTGKWYTNFNGKLTLYSHEQIIEMFLNKDKKETGIKDRNGNIILLHSQMLDTTGEVIGCVVKRNKRFVLEQGQDALGRDKWDYLEDAVKTGYTVAPF